MSEETLSVRSFGDFPNFDDCASTATTISAVKSWYSDIKEDIDRVLCTHFLPDAAVNLAPYAESILDEDDIDVNFLIRPFSRSSSAKRIRLLTLRLTSKSPRRR